MLRSTLIAFALLAVPAFYATPIAAGGGVQDDSYYSFGGDIVHFDVTATTDPNKVDVTATDDSGFSTATTGTAGADSTPADPTTQTTPTIATPGDEYKVTKGKPYKKGKNGKWIPGKKTKKPKKSNKSHSYMGSGNAVHGTSSSPGDDVVGLPRL